MTDFGVRFPSDRLYCTADGRLARKGDILFSVRAPVGRLNVADKDMILGRGVSAIRHNQEKQGFLWEQLKCRFTKDDMIGNGAIFASVTKNDMQSIQLLGPTLKFVDDFEQLIFPFHEELAVLDGQAKNLGQTRDLLLPRLMSGQLNVEDL